MNTNQRPKLYPNNPTAIGIGEKRCKGCCTVKPLDAFPPKGSRCRRCSNEYKYEYRRGLGREAHNGRVAKYLAGKYANDPVFRMKLAARNAVSIAVKKGILVKPEACSKCEAPKSPHALQGHHHHGYDKEHQLDVVWICAKCHRKEDFPNDPVRRDQEPHAAE
jgi:hypothetical protein